MAKLCPCDLWGMRTFGLPRKVYLFSRNSGKAVPLVTENFQQFKPEMEMESASCFHVSNMFEFGAEHDSRKQVIRTDSCRTCLSHALSCTV